MTDDPRGGALEIAEPAPPLPLPEDRDGTGSLLASLNRLRSALWRDRAAAPALASELLALAPERREDRLRQDSRFQTWGLCELLLTKNSEGKTLYDLPSVRAGKGMMHIGEVSAQGVNPPMWNGRERRAHGNCPPAHLRTVFSPPSGQRVDPPVQGFLAHTIGADMHAVQHLHQLRHE